MIDVTDVTGEVNGLGFPRKGMRPERVRSVARKPGWRWSDFAEASEHGQQCCYNGLPDTQLGSPNKRYV